MSQSSKRWIIKNTDGLLRGPYTTEQVLERISRGDFGSEDLISKYPGADWYPISQEPHFYDRLLEALSHHTPEEPPPPISEPDEPYYRQEEATFTPPLQTAEPSKVIDDDKTDDVELKTEMDDLTPPPDEPDQFKERSSTERRAQKEQSVKDKKDRRRKSRRKGSRSSAEDIELIDIKREVKVRVRKGAWKPALAAAIIMAAGLYLLLGDNPTHDERIRLIAPQINNAENAPEKAKDLINKGVAEYTADQFSSYVRAQNALVQAIEKSPTNAEVMAVLCLTYYELWPFAYQDSQDMKVLSTVTQAASALDGAGSHASTCKVVDLLLKGRYAEARSLSSSVLESFSGEGQPPIPFYYFMAILADASGDVKTAVGYLTTAQQLWPQWIRTFVYQAQIYTKLENNSEAARIYRQILTAAPNHDVAKIELGLLEYKHFRNIDRGAELLRAGLKSLGVQRKVRSKGHFGLAEIHLQRRESSEALIQAKKAYALDSTNSLAKNLMIQLGGAVEVGRTRFQSYQLIAEGDQFFREGDCNAAQAHYKAAYEADKKSAIAAMKAGECLWRLSLTTEAIEWLNKAITADPKLIEAYVTLADYYSQRFNFVAAAQVLLSAQRVAPKSYEVFRGFAMIEQRRSNPKGAVDSAKLALSIYDTDVESHVIMSEALTDMGQFDAAFSHAARARELDPNHRRAQIAFGRALAGSKGAVAAIDYFNQLVSTFPVVSEYRLALGKVLMQDERFADAEQVFFEMSQVDEKSKDALLWLGKARRAQTQYERALAAFDQAAILDPSDAEPLFEAGLLYLDINKPTDAQVQFQRVLRINKLYPLVHYQLGRAAMLLGDTATALKEAREERNNNPNLADAYLLAAEAYSAEQQYSLCVGEYQKAIKLRPQSAQIYVKMAICYRKADQLDVAISMLNQAAVQESGIPDIYRELGAIYEIKGELAEAAKAYQQYFVLNPNAADRALIEQKFQSLGRGK